MDNDRTARGSEGEVYARLDTADIPHIAIQQNEESFAILQGKERSGRHQGFGDAFHKLPEKLIEQILYQVDANTFASLVLLNRRWREISQTADLYAHHLSRCPSFALTHNVITGPFRTGDLKRFRSAFNEEARRNLFEAFLRPRHTLINLISVNANTSAALPRGEAFRFVFSPSGRTLLALSSSRIYVLNLGGQEVAVQRELKTLRRPLSAAVLDDGSMLAVLSTNHQINIYGLKQDGVEHLQVLVTDQPPRTIALAQEGTVLAVAYDSAVEVFSLARNALSTDRRSVRCEAVDSLAFSDDGSMIIGSSRTAEPGYTVVITAPYYTENDPSLSPRELHSRLWTTQILFPNSSSTCHLSSFLSSHPEGEAQWVITYDHVLGSFRTVRTDDTRTGAVYFIGPRSRRELPFKPTLRPAATNSGDLVATGFSNSRIYMYGIPQKVDHAPDMSHVFDPENGSSPLTSATLNRASLAVYSPPLSSISSESSEEDDLYSKVDWRQSLFVKGRRLLILKGATDMKWVENSNGSGISEYAKRLVIVAPGGVDSFAEALGDEPMPVDGGRIAIFDFDYSSRDGRTDEIAIEVGESQPELLPEHHGNIDVEVALERRRSVMRNRNERNNRSSLIRAATAGASPSGPWASAPAPYQPLNRAQDRINLYQHDSTPFSNPSLANEAGPHPIAVQPRGTRQLTSYLSNNPSGHVAFYRQSNQREIPHESDADNWVPPPPPYQRDAETALTPELRLSLLGTFAESHRRPENGTSGPRHQASTIPEEAEFSVSPAFNDLTRSTTLPRPSYRTRPLSDSSLSTISDWSSIHYRRRSTQDSSGASIISPISHSTPATASGNQQWNRRPSSATTNDSQPVLQATLTHPTSPIPLTASPSRTPVPTLSGTVLFSNLSSPTREQAPPASAPALVSVFPQNASSYTPGSNNSTPSSSPSTIRSITLTGKNLQQRLNYPTPPLPPEAMAEQSSDRVEPSNPPPNPGSSTENSASRPAELGIPDPSGQTPSASIPRKPLNQRWPQHRKPVPAPGRHLDPNRIGSSGAPPPRANTAPATSSQDFAAQSDPSPARRPSTSSSFRSPSHKRSSTNASIRPGKFGHKSRLQRLNPFSSSTPHNGHGEPDLASIHAGYGPRGSGPHPGGHPERRGSKFAKLEPIQSVSSSLGDTIGRVRTRGEDKGNLIRDRAGRCDVM